MSLRFTRRVRILPGLALVPGASPSSLYGAGCCFALPRREGVCRDLSVGGRCHLRGGRRALSDVRNRKLICRA